MKKLSILAWAAVLAMPTAQAAPTTINFDGAVNLDISTAHAGLTFVAPFPGTGPVRTWNSPTAHSGNNVLGLSGQNNFFAFNQSTGAIDIIFDTAVNAVSIAAAFVIATDQFLGIGGLPFMAAYNSSTISQATRIGLDTWDIVGDACLGNNFCTSGWDMLSLSSTSNDIKAIRLSGFMSTTGGVSRLAMFDTLTYDRASGGGGGGGTVPEPSSLLLAGMAGVALWGSRRKGGQRQTGAGAGAGRKN